MERKRKVYKRADTKVTQESKKRIENVPGTSTKSCVWPFGLKHGRIEAVGFLGPTVSL